MKEPIFKGATRPAIKWGVPLIALVGIFVPGGLVAMWGTALVSPWVLPAVVAVLAPLYAWMRLVTSRDDQRLIQMMLSARLAMASRYPGSWKARSYAASRARGSRDVWR